MFKILVFVVCFCSTLGWASQIIAGASVEIERSSGPLDSLVRRGGSIVSNWQDLQGLGIVEPRCMRCLRKAMQGYNIGPYGIGLTYWQDAYDRPYGTYRDYATCARDQACAANAVHRYMVKHRFTDCNDNGVLGECRDWIYMHMQGPTGCMQRYPPASLKSIVDDCYREYLQDRNY